MTEMKSLRNDFVPVSCKHNANFDIRTGVTGNLSGRIIPPKSCKLFVILVWNDTGNEIDVQHGRIKDCLQTGTAN